MLRLLFVLLLFSAVPLAGQSLPPIPERIVSIDCENRRTDDVLHDIAAQGKFEFAWDARLFDAAKPVTLHAHNVTVRRAIYLLFGNSITFKTRGNYLVLVAAPPPVAAAAPPKKRETVISGYTTDAATGQSLPHVSVYDSVSLASALSNEYGYYSLKLSGSKAVRVKVSRENYLDTFLVVTPGAAVTQDIAIRPVPPSPAPADTTHPPDSVVVVLQPHRTVENYRFLDSLIGFEAVKQSQNLKEFFRRGGQVSLLPYISTNGKLGGNVVNHFSFNVIAGYTGGTDGAEIGGALNIDRGDVRWMQVAGMGNVVGGEVKGVQTAGAFNFDLGTLKGVQIGGGVNVLLDTLKGVQVGGACNIIRGPVYGVQIGGGANLVTRDLDGVQIGGAANFTLGSVNMIQAGGVLNYAWATSGLQLGGALNFTLHELKGCQASGVVNYAGRVKGVQLAGTANITPDTLAGVQVSGTLNFARWMYGVQAGVINVAGEVHGGQIGLINIAGKCTGGMVFGLLSIVPHGMHELELSATEKGFMTVSFRTGIPKFYNILSFGIDPGYPEREVWSFGYGIGHRFLLNPHFNLALDLSAHHVNNGSLALYTNEWAQLAFTAEWRPARFFAIAAGPVFHYYISGGTEDHLSLFHPKPLYEEDPSAGYHAIGWIGGTIALRFF